MAIVKVLETKTLRFYFIEHCKAGTITTQLAIHRSVIGRVLSQAGIPKIKHAERSSIFEPFAPLTT